MNSRNWLISLVFISAVLVSACGLRPMYGVLSEDERAVSSERSLSNIYIANIPDREGQYLRNRLIDRFYRNGRPVDPDYELSVSKIVEKVQDFDITEESEATRAQMKLYVDMIMVDVDTKEVVLKRSLVSTASHNILDSQFTTRVSEDDARKAALNDLARQIELQVNLFVNR